MSDLIIDTSPKDWWQNFDLKLLKDADDCNLATSKFDDVVASLDTQIRAADFESKSGNFADPNWYRSATAALAYAKKTRKEIDQRRVGFLRLIGKEQKEEELQMQKVTFAVLERICRALERIAEKI